MARPISRRPPPGTASRTACCPATTQSRSARRKTARSWPIAALSACRTAAAGRACVSTAAGARGFHDAQLAGLVVAEDVASMVDPIVRLLRDVPLRHRVEAPETGRLARYQWAHCAGLQRALYDALLGDALG